METAGQTDSVDGEVLSRTGKEISSMNVPLVRNQLRSAEMLDAVRIHRQGGLTVALEEKRNVSVGDLCKTPWLVTQYCSQLVGIALRDNKQNAVDEEGEC